MKIRPVCDELFHKDGRTDWPTNRRTDDVNNSFLKFCEKKPKNTETTRI